MSRDKFFLVISLVRVNKSLCHVTQGGREGVEEMAANGTKWINEIPTFPIYYLAKPQPRERTWEDQWGKKTLLSLL